MIIYYPEKAEKEKKNVIVHIKMFIVTLKSSLLFMNTFAIIIAKIFTTSE